MNRGLMLTLVAGVMLAGLQKVEAAGRYLRHPVFRNLPRMEVRMESQFGYGDSGDLPFGLLGAYGIRFSDVFTAGLYGSYVQSDRDLPTRMREVYGLGLYGETAFDLGHAVIPYAGLRVGLLDPSGPTNPTLMNMAAYLGLRMPVSSRTSLTLAATYHLAEKDGFFAPYNYKRSGSTYSSAKDDVTVDLGVRYAF